MPPGGAPKRRWAATVDLLADAVFYAARPCVAPLRGSLRLYKSAVLPICPDVPLRQWVISFPFPLRYLFAAHPQAMGKALGIVYRAISTHLIHKAGFSLKDGATGAVSLRCPPSSMPR